MKQWSKGIAFGAMALILAGCAGKSGTATDDEFGSESGSAGGALSWPDDEGGADGSAMPIGDDRASVVMNDRIVYFAYDSAELDDGSIEILKQHGRYLADNPGETVRLEGHADERGSREYNIGLGERRAVAVQSMLLIHGAAPEQLVTVSYGEERPASLGTGDEVWALNRRVELAYAR
ncbi:MAG: OmpA family protein [Gammaproteobacteria bacterium]|jgi:peptidoglycan-associated lipoprotein|nr:OmpA family protein [Gammaproteobacteria bacterium]